MKLFLYSKYIIIILLTSLFNPIGTFIYVKPTSDILTIFKFPFPPHVLIFLIANFQCVSNGYYMFQIKVILPGSFRGYYLYYKSVFFFIVFSKWVLLVYQKTVDFYIFILYPIFLWIVSLILRWSLKIILLDFLGRLSYHLKTRFILS